MHSLDLLEEAIELASQAGIEVRREYLEESAGGACRVGPNWQLFVDLSLPVDEQLTQVVQALRLTRLIESQTAMSPPLHARLFL